MILAAGESRRMGSPKPLLRIGNRTFLEELIAVFEASSAEPVVVVLGHEAERLLDETAWGEAVPVVNPDYPKGMLSSIRAGLEALPESRIEGVLLCPVDHPRIPPSLVDHLIRRFEATRRPIVLPVHRGRRGHPVLFARELFAELREASDELGARQVVWNHQEELLEVPTDEEGIHIDVDTPQDYERLTDGNRT